MWHATKKTQKLAFFNQKTCVCETFLVLLQRKNVACHKNML